jgi:hypothetical protein
MATWCGRCDKCCFIDLILAPYLSRDQLHAVFGDREPLEDPGLVEVFSSLLGRPGLDKPLECVGDQAECRAAVLLAAARDDRVGNAVLQVLREHVASLGEPVPDELALLRPQGRHFVPVPTVR